MQEVSAQQKYYAMRERVWNLERELDGCKFQLSQLKDSAIREAKKFLADVGEACVIQ